MTHDKTCIEIPRKTNLTHVWTLILLKGHGTTLAQFISYGL